MKIKQIAVTATSDGITEGQEWLYALCENGQVAMISTTKEPFVNWILPGEVPDEVFKVTDPNQNLINSLRGVINSA